MTQFYRDIVTLIKAIDKFTNYRIGNIIRGITNVNTERYWKKELASKGEFWRDFPYRHLLEFLPKDSYFTLLDIGCALGDGCVVLKDHFPEAEINGADFSDEAIEKAKRKAENIVFFVLNILKQTPNRKYDYITFVSILEHFNNPFDIVDRCLKFVNAALIVYVPYTEKIDNPRLYWRGQHRYLFNEDTFINYHCEILKITEKVESSGYRYIIYKLVP